MRTLFLDIEVYRNYFLALFMTEDLRVKRFEIIDNDTSNFDAQQVLDILTCPDVEIVTFNGETYDIPILTYALVTPDTAAIKRASDRVIMHNVRPWSFYRNEGLAAPKVNHIDLIDVAPGVLGLKMYAGRLNVKSLQELPIEPSATVDAAQISELRRYCKKDTISTQVLFNALREQIDLRRMMGEKYGIDLRSKSDAQIAEAVLKAEFFRLTHENPSKVELATDRFFYNPPAYIKFSTPPLQAVLKTVCGAEMVVSDKTGHVKMPRAIASLKIEIGTSRYKIGIGGLHSQESEVTLHSDEDSILIEEDVESYYPRMMLNMKMRLGGFGEHFNTVYGAILEERLAAKHAGDSVKSSSLKIVLNSTFGKTANRYSTLYSPAFMIRTTLTGQLTMLMLIEALEQYGISVVSGNTDGIVVKCLRSDIDALNTIIRSWEKHTGLKTEANEYASLYARDVNNYIAVKADGKVKAKGVYGPVSLSKNPQNSICAEAVIDYLTQGIPVEDSVRYCTDITKFLTLRAVTGGAVKDGQPLGKAIRWYYAKGERGAIHYQTNGNMVARSEGAKPLMDLPDQMPLDVDFDWYIRECYEILMSIGVQERPYVEKLPRKNSNAWKELRDSGMIFEYAKGKWKLADENPTYTH